MKLTVLGCGRWGTFLASYHSANHDVMLWGRPGSASMQELMETRKNSYLTLPENLRLTQDLGQAMEWADAVIISISAQHLRQLAAQLQQMEIAGKVFILCMKGIEVSTNKRLTQVMEEEIHQPIQTAVWVGPGHVQDFSAGIPNCMVVDSASPETTDWVVEQLGSELIRLYKGRDLIGTEVGAAAKNVIGIAAGVLDGIGYTSLKGALMARGAREISRLIRSMGGNELSAYGLCHLGDYEATLFSAHSHNRRFGESFVKGEHFDHLAEGASTVKALVELGSQNQVELPICRAVYDMLYEGKDVHECLPKLFQRTVKGEFDY
ncbi:MAG: NAD(P)H-dependent glycerol-3-phosphate dehydrogenase [Candidatus Fournierella pullistercoris]|uniref:Glycerol-3-phosphate dehydrogenase n=1 Tax=Candidatus Allofournierella pullistercoris TaxID=2838597 RepID=A0A948T300_9FIRM|nr:NAD(P)H-dependent glycerol-3-phosphate dehydrogenase [Candidatus Fournierella pullistercoris]